MFGLKKDKPAALKKVWSGAVPDHAIGLGWSADGKHLAVAASTGPVAVFDARAGTGDVHLAGHPGGTLALAWSAGGTLATAGKDGRVRLWNAAGEPTHCLETTGRWVEHLAWHPDGSKLAAASGRTVHVWDASGEHVADLDGHPSTVSDVAWRPGTGTLAASAYGGVLLWTLRGTANPAYRLFAWKGSPLKMAWSPDGTMLAHGNQDSTVHFWYADDGRDLQMWGYPTKVRELSWDRTSRFLATGGSSAVCVWDCGGKGPEGTQPRMLAGHAEGTPLAAVQFQHRRDLLASAGTDSRVCVWQPSNATRPLLASAVVGAPVLGLAWSPDDALLAVADERGGVAVCAAPRSPLAM